MAKTIENILKDILDKLTGSCEEPDKLIDSVDTDIDAKVKSLAIKLKDGSPQSVIALISKMDSNDIDGVYNVFNIRVDVSDEFGQSKAVYKKLKESAPGACELLEGILSQLDSYMKKFGNSKELGKKVHELYVTLKSKISSQLKLDKDALNKIVESLKKEFPSTSIFDLNASLAMIDLNDLDGFKKVLEDANQGNINNIKELQNAMEEKCYSLLEALRMIYVKLTIIFDNLDEDGKRLIKNVGA
uniref:Uncharacterized protein n=1 Tax=Meloidogyne javanica TaxID=6303 RepID=A0A915MCE8_MELJA